MRTKIKNSTPVIHRSTCPHCGGWLDLEPEVFLKIKRDDLEVLFHELTRNAPTPEFPENVWISAEEAMSLLGISSKSHFQKLKNEGNFEVSELSRKVHRINRDSVLAYIESHKTAY